MIEKTPDREHERGSCQPARPNPVRIPNEMPVPIVIPVKAPAKVSTPLRIGVR